MIRVRQEAFGFGADKEVRKVVSLSWRVGTRALENFVERTEPYQDPWLDQNDARLLLHEEEAQITLPANVTEITLNEAKEKLETLALNLSALVV